VVARAPAGGRVPPMVLHEDVVIEAEGSISKRGCPSTRAPGATVVRPRAYSAPRRPEQRRVRRPLSPSTTPIPAAARRCSGGPMCPPVVPGQPRPFRTRNPTRATRSPLRALVGQGGRAGATMRPRFPVADALARHVPTATMTTGGGADVVTRMRPMAWPIGPKT
jgi:hypothetical protein